MITERTQIDLENMRQVVLLNAQKASVDIRETSAEYKIVNDWKVLCLQFRGTIKSIKFVYFVYYYSDANGKVQLLSYTAENLFNQVHKELESFVNGLVEVD